MRSLSIFTVMVSGICLMNACAGKRQVATDGTVTREKTPITTLSPNSSNPSRSVLNASGDALTIGIPNGNDLRAGSSENATAIVNTALAKVNGPTGVNQQRLDSLTAVDFMNKIAVHQITLNKMSTLVQGKSTDKKVLDFAKALLTSLEQEQKDLRKLSAYSDVILPAAVNITQQADNLTPESYLQMVIEGQQSAIRVFEVGNKSKDPEIKAFAERYIPIYRKRLQEAQALRNSKL